MALKIRNVKAGDKVDVRDTEYIWCVGNVELKITSLNHPTLLYIHYEVRNRSQLIGLEQKVRRIHFG